MNKKITASAVIIVIVAASIATWFVNNQISELQSQNSDLQKQVNELQDQVNELQHQNKELQDQNSELQDQNSELQNQLFELENINAAHDVKITAFAWVGGYSSLGQVNLFQSYKVTIKNMGNNNVSGLTLYVELLSVGTDRTIGDYTSQIDFIHAGEIVEIGGLVSVGRIDSYAHTAVGVITLTVGDVLLDRWTRNLEGSF
jgi:regulator of replication initiation timing